MKKPMLTASEVIEFSNQLGAASYKTLDQFFCKIWGVDYYKVPFYHELKTALENMMERIEVQYPNYVTYEWVCK